MTKPKNFNSWTPERQEAWRKKARENDRKFREANREKRRENDRKFREANREKRLENVRKSKQKAKSTAMFFQMTHAAAEIAKAFRGDTA